MNRILAATLLAFVQICGTAAFAATNLPFRSDFESGDFSEWNGGLDTTMRVTSSDASSGRYSTSVVMTRGQTSDNYKEFLFGDHVRIGGLGVSREAGLWLSLDTKFDQGFSFGSSSSVHKIAIINFEDENGRRRYQIILNVFNSNGDYFLEHLKWNADRTFNRAIPGLAQNIGTPARVRPGQWDRIKLYIKPNTPGLSDGIVRMWVNGALKMENTRVAVREDTSYNPNKLIMSNYVMDTTTEGTQRWDNFYLGEADPDGEARRPNPPILNSVQ